MDDMSSWLHFNIQKFWILYLEHRYLTFLLYYYRDFSIACEISVKIHLFNISNLIYFLIITLFPTEKKLWFSSGRTERTTSLAGACWRWPLCPEKRLPATLPLTVPRMPMELTSRRQRGAAGTLRAEKRIRIPPLEKNIFWKEEQKQKKAWV